MVNGSSCRETHGLILFGEGPFSVECAGNVEPEDLLQWLEFSTAQEELRGSEGVLKVPLACK